VEAKGKRLVILGAGPGGYVAALRAAQLGAAVTLVERDLVGGTCLNRGCIPTKVLLASAAALAHARAGEEFGFVVPGEVRPDLARMMERKERIVSQLRSGVETLLKRAGVQVLRGSGRLAGPRTVVVEQESADAEADRSGAHPERAVAVEADRIILATGSEPARLPAFDFDHPAILTSTEALELREIPSSMLIVGAGAIGCEFASFFAELGTQVTMVEMLAQMLPSEDLRLAKQFQAAYRKKGIQVLLKTKVDSIVKYGEQEVTARLSDGSEVTVEKVLVSVGRTPNTAGLGLDLAGVQADSRGYVMVDEYLETSAPGVYAIGDVNGGLLLAHVASHEGWVAVANALADDPAQRQKRDPRSTPSCTYAHPEVASVGLSEEQAREAGYEPVTGTYRFAALGKALALGEEAGYVQIVADKKTDQVLGASMMGPHVTDLIHEVALALHNGLTARQLGSTIHAHPTLAEAVMEAAHEVHGESVHVAH
jgi:dihydrolipoamide dehydrogenase